MFFIKRLIVILNRKLLDPSLTLRMTGMWHSGLKTFISFANARDDSVRVAVAKFLRYVILNEVKNLFSIILPAWRKQKIFQ